MIILAGFTDSRTIYSGFMLVFRGDGEEGVFSYDGVTHLSSLERMDHQT